MANCEDVFSRCTFLTIYDQWIQKKVTINTIFFRHFKQGFSIFLEVFYKIFFV